MGKPRSEWKQPKRTGLKPRTHFIARGTKPLTRSAIARRLDNCSSMSNVGYKIAGRLYPKRKRTAAQERAKFAREFGSLERVAWMKASSCSVSGCLATPCDNAHTAVDGTSRKAHHSTIAPLCADVVETGYAGHHSQYDNGKTSFEATHQLDMKAIAAAKHAEWLALQAAA